MHEIGDHLTGLKQLKVMMKRDLRPGIGETLDIRLIRVEEGHMDLEATPDVHPYNPIGTVHGGFAATMLDFACGYAVLSTITPGMSFSTLGLKVAYHKVVTKDTGPARAEGTIVTMGGVHGSPAGGFAGPSVRLGHIEPSGDATSIDELEPAVPRSRAGAPRWSGSPRPTRLRSGGRVVVDVFKPVLVNF